MIEFNTIDEILDYYPVYQTGSKLFTTKEGLKEQLSKGEEGEFFLMTEYAGALESDDGVKPTGFSIFKFRRDGEKYIGPEKVK